MNRCINVNVFIWGCVQERFRKENLDSIAKGCNMKAKL